MATSFGAQTRRIRIGESRWGGTQPNLWVLEGNTEKFMGALMGLLGITGGGCQKEVA